MAEYSSMAPKTKMIQAITQVLIAVKPSAFGELVWMVLWMLMRTRKRVTSIVILPGITSGLIRKLIQEMTTNRIPSRLREL